MERMFCALCSVAATGCAAVLFVCHPGPDPENNLQVTTMYHLDRPMYLLGYLAAQNRVFLIDK